MNAIVVVFASAPNEKRIAEAPAALLETCDVLQGDPPFWTWFIENPRRFLGQEKGKKSGHGESHGQEDDVDGAAEEELEESRKPVLAIDAPDRDQ